MYIYLIIYIQNVLQAIQILGLQYNIKGDSGIMCRKKDTQIQIRINKMDKAKLKYLSEKRGYKSLSDYILYLVMKDISESEFINKRMK